MKKTKVGIIGCGAISGIYMYNCSRLRNLELVALADLDPERAAAKVEEVRTTWSGAWKLPGEQQYFKS